MKGAVAAASMNWMLWTRLTEAEESLGTVLHRRLYGSGLSLVSAFNMKQSFEELLSLDGNSQSTSAIWWPCLLMESGSCKKL